ncbi:DUF445 domain-containing protein [Syntrophomonas palmitatica]|uniref:DUF445 domain-containing protein n=1 Tax=Syntrophomonas palmitatica TaxID=402877 RepID=UPI0006D17804|nr:DUF445 family protein [Syntrophomonas palmitatica]
MKVQLLLIPLISALIGYITNVVAVKMLFWPRQPINLFFFELYGVLPKRRSQVASSLGQLVEEQLLSIDDLFDKINTPDVRDKIISRIMVLLRDRLNNLLPRLIPAKVVQVISETLEKILRQEAENMVHQIIEYGRDYLTKEVQIRKIVEDKVNAFDLKQLEDMIWSVSSPELKFIEILGGVLGLIIGLVQVSIMFIFPL